ncbi:MAG: glycosyltransferase [Oscillospiraceae bacterium]|nr:glycosyltransferase [Oscillospiraceae bacterium]
MIKVLFLIESLDGGGAEKILADLANHMDHSRFAVEIRTVTDGGVWARRVREPVRLRSLLHTADARTGGPRALWYKLRYHLLRRLPAGMACRLFLRGRYDVVAAFCEGLVTRLAAAAPRRLGRKFAWVHTDHINNPHADALFRHLKRHRRAYLSFDEVLCVSESVRKNFIEKFGALPRLSVQYNPVDIPDIIEKAAEPIELPASEGPILLCVARLVPAKGVDRLLRAARELKEADIPFALWIMGDGPRREELEGLIAAFGLRDRVVLLGYRQNPYPFLRAAALYASASYAEGFSTAATEALVLGTPIVSTDCAGMREVLGEEPCGILTENSWEGFYRELRELLLHPERIPPMEAAAARRAARFSLEERVREVEEKFIVHHI